MYDKNSLNKAQLIGRLGQDPEAKETKNGTKVAKFSLATQTQGKDKEPQTEWHRLIAFGKRAEIVENYVGKGDQVYIEGKLQTDSWEDKDGNKKQATKVVVNQLLRVSGKGSSKSSSEQIQQFDNQDDSFPF